MLETGVGDQFKLLVALASLAHRPVYQSLSSYLIDLRARFPLSAQSTMASRGPDWRTHALALEEQLAELNSKLQKERMESALLRANQSLSSTIVRTAAEVPEEHDHRPKKKKKTQQEVEITLPPDWQKTVQDLDPTLRPSAFDGELEIFSSLATLHRLSASDDGSYTEAQLRGDVLTLTGHCLKSLGKMLKYALELPAGSLQASRLSEAVSSVLPIILAQSLHLMPGNVTITDVDCSDVFLRTFHEEVFRPIIKGFVLLSEVRATNQLGVTVKAATDRLLPKFDIRPILLAICQSGIDNMKLKSGLYESLSLLVAYTTMVHIQHEIRQRPSVAPERKIEAPSTIKKQRAPQITSRDSLWYLMALLNTSICLVPPRSSPIEIATRDGILDMLLRLLEPGEDRSRLRLMEQNMILGIAEKAWAAGWFPTCAREENTEPIINVALSDSSVTASNE